MTDKETTQDDHRTAAEKIHEQMTKGDVDGAHKTAQSVEPKSTGEEIKQADNITKYTRG